MLKLKSIHIQNLKSFHEDKNEIRGFSQLNIFIGKNNQGKSNLLKAIQLLDYNNLRSFLNDIPDINNIEVKPGYSTSSSNKIFSIFHYKSGKSLGSFYYRGPIKIKYILEIDKKTHIYEIKIEGFFWKTNGKFTYIDENKKIREKENPISTYYDGEQISINEVLGDPENIVYKIPLSHLNYDFESMKNNLLGLRFKHGKRKVKNFINKINNLSPDFHKLFLTFGDYVFPPNFAGRKIEDVSQQIFDEKWFLNARLFLDDTGLTSESLGSGQLQSLALLYEIEMASLKNAPIITIDEMELHLYPSLQKGLLREMKRYSKKHQFFISTHSNILISMPLKQKIFFVRKKDDFTHVKLRNTKSGLFDILNEIGAKASDILQSNGVIWVEGPSDILILKEWLMKLGVSQNDLDQISFIFYGGVLINHIKFSKLLDVNRNCVVIQDSDKNSKNAPLNDKKRLIKKECESLGIHCWTTNVREIENYFSVNAIKMYKDKFQKRTVNLSVKYDEYTDIKEVIPNYEEDKSGNGKIIASFMSKRDIQKNEELFKELCKIKDNINKWNK